MFQSIDEMRKHLATVGCTKCSLGLQKEPHGPVLSRGPLNAPLMLVGEALGKIEVEQQTPFIGPAGQLLELWFKSIDLPLEKYVYISNSLLCRPVAPKGSGRENLTPTLEMLNSCRPYLTRQIELVKPQIVIACGLSAAKNLLTLSEKTSMGSIAGKWFTQPQFPQQKFFVLYHPAALLHAGQGSDRYNQLKELVIQHLQSLKNGLST